MGEALGTSLDKIIALKQRHENLLGHEKVLKSNGDLCNVLNKPQKMLSALFSCTLSTYGLFNYIAGLSDSLLLGWRKTDLIFLLIIKSTSGRKYQRKHKLQ